LGSLAAEDFGPIALESVRNQMIATGNSRKYINGNINSLGRMFRWGVQKELVLPSTHQALVSLPALRKGRTAARETAPIEPVSSAVVSETIKHATTIIADMIKLQYLLGCRPGELCSMKSGEVDCSGDVWLPLARTQDDEAKPFFKFRYAQLKNGLLNGMEWIIYSSDRHR
jgi:integrase